MDITNIEKLTNAFCSALEIDSSMIDENLKYQSIPQWDSITHMFLIDEIESVFEIEINSDHILDLNSFENAKTVLSNYDMTF